MNPIVIVGSGLAGYNVARELRKLDKEIPLTLIAADSAHFYSKPMLSSALGSGKAPAAIAMNTAEQMSAQLSATVRAHVHVTAIGPAQHTVHLRQETLAYSKLVLALGADQIRLTIAGNAAERVMTVNDLTDYTQFRATIAGKESVAVIGGGLIGCEFANDLTSGGFKVSVIDIAPQPLSRLLPPQGATMLQNKLAALGVDWRLGTSVIAIDSSSDKLQLTLANGATIVVDAVLSAVGLRPRIALAQAAGLKTNRGIVVDRHLATSDADVYALGDCAEVAGLVLPYVMPIMHSARALAATLAGKPTPVAYPAMPVLVKTPACPTIISPPPAGIDGQWVVTADADGVKSVYQDAAGKMWGYALNGKATAERAALTAQLPPVLS